MTRLAVDLEHVEDLVDERRGLPCCIAEKLGRPCSSSATDLAVDDRVGRAERLRRAPSRPLRTARVRSLPFREQERRPRRRARSRARGSRPTSARTASPPHAAASPSRSRASPGRRAASRASPPVVALAQEEPVLLVAGEVRGNERPRPLEPLAVQPDGQAAVGLLLDELVRAVIPDLDRAGAVVPLRDLARERRVLERVVLDVDGEMLLAGLERHALRHRPGGEHAVALEAEVVVEPPRVVALHDEDRRLRLPALAPERLRGLLAVALALVLRELSAHEGFLPPRDLESGSRSPVLSVSSRTPRVHTTHT